MIILFLFMTKLKREKEAARMKASMEINKDTSTFLYNESERNWSVEEFVDGSYKMGTFINQL
jgi:hypothetical protein